MREQVAGMQPVLEQRRRLGVSSTSLPERFTRHEALQLEIQAEQFARRGQSRFAHTGALQTDSRRRAVC